MPFLSGALGLFALKTTVAKPPPKSPSLTTSGFCSDMLSGSKRGTFLVNTWQTDCRDGILGRGITMRVPKSKKGIYVEFAILTAIYTLSFVLLGLLFPELLERSKTPPVFFLALMICMQGMKLLWDLHHHKRAEGQD